MNHSAIARHFADPVTNLVGVESEVALFSSGARGADALPAGSPELLDARVARVLQRLAAAAGGVPSTRVQLQESGRGYRLAPLGPADLAADYRLPNGARAYCDHGYAEYSTPPLAAADLAVAAIEAGDTLLASAAAAVSADGAGLAAIRNNVDARGRSCGAHVNVRMTRSGYDRIFGDARALHETVMPMFVALPVLCGAGRPSDDSRTDGFGIWQRASYIRRPVGLDTMVERGVVNTRDEPLSADPHLARLHIIHLDANRCQIAEFLKLGLLQLLCGMIDALPAFNFQLELQNPLTAIRTLNRNPQAKLPLADGRALTPVDILRRYVAVFETLEARGLYRDRVPCAKQILVEADAKLRTLADNKPFDLIGQLDWPTKLAWLDQTRREHGLKWSDPRLRLMDIEYHNLSRPAPTTRRACSDLQAESLRRAAPAGTRAELAGALIERFGDELAIADWHFVVSGTSGQAFFLPDEPPPQAVETVCRAQSLDEAGLRLGLWPAELQVCQLAVADGQAAGQAAGGAAGDSEGRGEEAGEVAVVAVVAAPFAPGAFAPGDGALDPPARAGAAKTGAAKTGIAKTGAAETRAAALKASKSGTSRLAPPEGPPPSGSEGAAAAGEETAIGRNRGA